MRSISRIAAAAERIADTVERDREVLRLIEELRHDQRWLVSRVVELTEENKRVVAQLRAVERRLVQITLRPRFTFSNRREES